MSTGFTVKGILKLTIFSWFFSSFYDFLWIVSCLSPFILSNLCPVFKFDDYDSFQIILGAIIFITSRLWRSSSEEQGDLKSIKAHRSMRVLLVKCVFCLFSCLLARLFCMTDITVCNEVHHQVFVCKGWISYEKTQNIQ